MVATGAPEIWRGSVATTMLLPSCMVIAWLWSVACVGSPRGLEAAVAFRIIRETRAPSVEQHWRLFARSALAVLQVHPCAKLSGPNVRTNLSPDTPTDYDAENSGAAWVEGRIAKPRSASLAHSVEMRQLNR